MRSASILVLLWLWSSTAFAGPITLYVFGDTPGTPRGDVINSWSQNGDCGVGTRVSSGDAGTEHDPFFNPCLPGGGSVFITNDLSIFGSLGDGCGAGTRVSTGEAGTESDPLFNPCLPGGGSVFITNDLSLFGSRGDGCGAGIRVSGGSTGTESDPFFNPCLPGRGGIFITNDLSLFGSLGDGCGAGTRVSGGEAGTESDPLFNPCLPGGGCGAGTRVSTGGAGTEDDPFFNPCLPGDEPFSARLLSSLVDENSECIFCSLEPELVTFALRIDVAEPAAAVPAPASLAMFGVGLAGLGICRHRRSNFRRS
ncbi:MAG: PEP-CTERM sorting domain-containing protein [Pseudomonadota bacterium]